VISILHVMSLHWSPNRAAQSGTTSPSMPGYRALVVGKVSMNTLMVDVTDIPTAHPGDEVALFGKQGGGEIT